MKWPVASCKHRSLFFFFILSMLGQPVLSHAQPISSFLDPPPAARPGVYWYFMDGNRSKAAMTEDLEAMKKAGIGSLIFLEVNVGVPRGPVDFLSEAWKDMFAHAVSEGKRLGIAIILGTGPGWAGSGGPWVKPEQSMQHLVASVTRVTGKGKIVLPVPPPKPPYFGMGALTPGLKILWDNYYQDVAVLAFPTPSLHKTLDDIGEKALYYRAPYSSTPNVKQYLPAPAIYPAWPAEAAIPKEGVIDLTDKLTADGLLHWDPPPGNWTVMRFVARNNGAVTRPAPVPGLGFEVNKMDTVALQAHLDEYVGQLLERTGEPDTAAIGGFKRLHIDSWEMGAQNWTPHFREEFTRRRGYDPLPFYPVYDSIVVGSRELSERFLWDLRQTAQELVLEYHAGQVKKYSHRHGLLLSIEPYDMNPTADLELGSVADIPMCEFWSKGLGFNSAFSCIEAASIAHVNGIKLLPAEAFTAQDNEGWKQYPGSMKNQGDWAFAAGINQFVYHTFQNQNLADSLVPGMTMGPYGVHWDRNQTWWPMVDGYHHYITRCQALLQQGRTVADILYLTPEGAPQVFRAPPSALAGDAVLPDRKGFNFDGCSPGQLYKAAAHDGFVVFPGGASYRLLVLPAWNTMTPALLKKIRSLVEQGATVLGSPPLSSPGLSGWPACDEELAVIAKTIWGSLPSNEPTTLTVHTVGKGKVIWGGECSIARVLQTGSLYPDYDATARLLDGMGLKPDFQSPGPLRYTHRTDPDWDLYFVSNRSGDPVKTEASFRAVGGTPQLWDALTGEMRPLPEYTTRDGQTIIPLQFEAYQSFFVVFNHDIAITNTDAANPTRTKIAPATHTTTTANFPPQNILSTLTGPWTLHFNTVRGGPASATFDSLSDWTQNADSGIRYYSGIAHYERHFDLPKGWKKGGHLFLDLGTVKDLARVTVNGVDLGVVWTAPYKVDLTAVVQAKGNRIDIAVANRWPNRLIGDEFLPDDGIHDGQWPDWLTKGLPRTSGRHTFATYKFYEKDSPLLPSGLLGPVTIRQ